jgi:nucleoside-diphosphate-sugar epimerase
MKVFITGGLGFIGTYLSKALADKGANVVVYDNFTNYINPDQSNYYHMLSWRLKHIDKKVEILRGDVRVQKSLIRAVRKFEPDVIINLAALAIAQKTREFADEATTINVHGTLNALESLRELKKVKKFIFFSSSFVYGNFKRKYVVETDSLGPIDIYGGTKLTGEIFTETYCRELGFPYVIIRPSAVYGYGDANNRVSYKLIENAFLKKPLIVHDENTRLDFTYIEDIVQGTLKCIYSPKANNQIFNITYGEACTIKEYINILKEYFPKIKVKKQKSDILRPKRGTLDISKAKKLLGYQPQYPLERGLREYLKGVKEYGLNVDSIK